MAYNFIPFQQKIAGIAEWLKGEFSSIRTGRATPMILDSVVVESYGSKMQIREVASVNVEDPKTLRIVPWDATQTKNIEKGISDANLGLSVSVDDKGLRIIFPELTGERRTDLVKVLKKKHEEARISLRLERDKTKSDLDAKEKLGGMGEDEKHRHTAEIQKLVDEANNKFDEMAAKKEKEILEN
jgi:ribosome recycling factor